MVKFPVSRAGWIFASWTGLGLIAAGSSYVRSLASGASDVSAYSTLWHYVLDYWIWAALTPLIFQLCRSLPFTSGRLLGTITLHVGICIVTSWLHVTIAQLLNLPAPFSRGFQGPALVGRFIWTFYSDVWMYCGAAGAWYLVDYHEKFKEREFRAAQLQIQLANAKVQALRHQLQPHFLFNTLNSISALIQDDGEAAEDMLADLSYMLRSVLECDAQEIPFSDELNLLNAYFRIQLRRFATLSVQMDIEESTKLAMVPTLFLQPIVENAIRHGVAPLSRPCNICIRSRCDDEFLIVEIDDDGQGLSPNYTEGIGLLNTRERFRQIYGGRYSLRVQSRVGQGVTTRVAIPLRRNGGPENGGLVENNDGNRGRRTVSATTT